jgi:hypothetical protein
MTFRYTPTLLGCIFAVATMLAIPLAPRAISQESQQSRPLRDVCREGWSRYTCGPRLVRLCVSPEVEREHDVTATPAYREGGCYLDQTLVPEAWAHAGAEQMGYLAQDNGMYAGYNFRGRVLNLDSSNIKDAELEKLMWESLITEHQGEDRAYSRGFSEFEASLPAKSLESYGLPPAPTTGKELCPATYSRFSCQFVRLCVSPSVVARYDLKSSKEFGYANCKADDRAVSEQDINFKPHDVGVAAGALVGGPVYFKAVKLDSSDILDGNIEEAVERLVLVPIPINGLMEYDRGYQEGQARFQRILDKAK